MEDRDAEKCTRIGVPCKVDCIAAKIFKHAAVERDVGRAAQIYGACLGVLG